MSEDAFESTFVSTLAPSGSTLWSKEEIAPGTVDLHHIWTVLESGVVGNDRLYLSAGVHLVNAIGYVVTEEPWVTGFEESVWDDTVEDDEASMRDHTGG